jgi:ADP-ribose pyrophosphatase
VFRKLAEREHYRGALIAVATATFADPDGATFARDVVHHPGAVSVVPVLDAPGGPEVLLVRQFRAPVEAELLEIPAGKRDVAGEPPEATARRELEEEVGVRAARLELLATFYNSPGFCDEFSYVFLATGLEPTAPTAHSVEERHMRIERVRLDALAAMIATGEIRDAKTIIGLCLARSRLGAAPPPGAGPAPGAGEGAGA